MAIREQVLEALQASGVSTRQRGWIFHDFPAQKALDVLL